MRIKYDFFKDLEEHIKQTQKDKYAGKNLDVNTFLNDQDILLDFAIGNIIKYSARYRSAGDRKNLLKAAHYIQIIYTMDE